MPIQFSGGPLNGQGMMTDEEMSAMEPPVPSAAPESGGGDEASMFRSLLENIRGLLAMDTLSEKNKLALEKASTLVQQIKADEEKDEEAAMTGKINPTVMRKLGGSGGAGY